MYKGVVLLLTTPARLCFWTVSVFRMRAWFFATSDIYGQTHFFLNSTREILHNLILKIEVLGESVNSEIYVKIPAGVFVSLENGQKVASNVF